MEWQREAEGESPHRPAQKIATTAWPVSCTTCHAAGALRACRKGEREGEGEGEGKGEGEIIGEAEAEAEAERHSESVRGNSSAPKTGCASSTHLRPPAISAQI